MGLFFHTWGWALGVILQPTGRLKAFTLFNSLNQLSRVGIVLLLTPVIGLYSWMLTYSAVPFIFFGAYVIYFIQVINLKIDGANIGLMVYGVASSLAIILLSEFVIMSYIAGPLFIGGMWFFMKKNEREYINKLYQERNKYLQNLFKRRK